MTACRLPEMECEHRGNLVICRACPWTREPGPSALTPRMEERAAWYHWTLKPGPVLGCDPGVHMGLALVDSGRVLWTAQINWDRPGAVQQLVEAVVCADKAGALVGVLEVLGHTKGAARGFASSWATMSRTAGRFAQEWQRRGLALEEVDPETWRSRLHLPGSWGAGKVKTEHARRYAAELLGLEERVPHLCEAALIALSATVERRTA